MASRRMLSSNSVSPAARAEAAAFLYWSSAYTGYFSRVTRAACRNLLASLQFCDLEAELGSSVPVMSLLHEAGC